MDDIERELVRASRQTLHILTTIQKAQGTMSRQLEAELVAQLYGILTIYEGMLMAVRESSKDLGIPPA